jgi:hypothetical protein
MTAGMPPRAVVDTSALVPARLRRRVQETAGSGVCTVLWSPWIIGELYRVLTWQWLERTRDFSAANEAACSRSAKAMMTLLISTFEIVAPVPPYPPTWPTLSDSDDHPIWATAVLGQAQYVVSENTRHFPPLGQDGRHMHQGIEYLTTLAFLDRLVPGNA